MKPGFRADLVSKLAYLKRRSHTNVVLPAFWSGILLSSLCSSAVEVSQKPSSAMFPFPSLNCVSLSFPSAEVSLRPSSRASMRSSAFPDRLLTVPEMSGPDSPDPPGSPVTEMFITEENISKMENILETWSNNLKVSDFFC